MGRQELAYLVIALAVIAAAATPACSRGLLQACRKRVTRGTTRD